MSPAYSASLQQASPYYAASSYTPSPLGNGLAYTLSPPPQELPAYTYASLQRPSPCPPTVPHHQELGIAPSRVDEVFIARQYEAAERRIARAVPDGLARAGQRRHNQEEDTGATLYTVAEEHLQNMRQALAGGPVPTMVITEIHPGSDTSAPVDVMPAITPSPATGSAPPLDRKDYILELPKIEEGKEPSEESSEIQSADESNNSPSDDHERHVNTPHGDTTPELSSGSGSPASADTFLFPVSDYGLGIDGCAPSSAGLDNSGWDPNWKLPVPLSSVNWMDELKWWEDETINLLALIGIERVVAL